MAKCLKVKEMKFQVIHVFETLFYFSFKFVKDRLVRALAAVLKVSRCAVHIWHPGNPARQRSTLCVLGTQNALVMEHLLLVLFL